MKVNAHVVKSIVGSSLFKLGSSFISLISVPLLLDVLGKSDYGLWVTITALVAWLNLFDFGAGYSLKNKLAELFAKREFGGIQRLIAGTFQFYFLVTIVIFILFILGLLYLKALSENVILSLTVYIPIIVSYPFTLGSLIIQAVRKFNTLNFIYFLQSLAWLAIVIFASSDLMDISVEQLAWFYSSLYVLVNAAIFFIAIKSVRFNYCEILDLSNFYYSKPILFVGFRFFVLQLSSLLLYSLGNILTFENLTPSEVAEFDTINKVYLTGLTIFNVVISVFWTEISRQKVTNPHLLLNLFKSLLSIATAFSIGAVAVTIVLPYVIPVWTKDKIAVELNQLAPFIILFLVQSFAYVGAVFLNAFEKLKGQILFSFSSSIFIIPFSTVFFKSDLGIGSVPLASAVLTLPTMLFVLTRSYNIIKKL